MVANTKIEIINHIDRQLMHEVQAQNDNTQSLDDLDMFEVFDKLLEERNISDDKKEELKTLYKEVCSFVVL